jgi:hypothetical protein
MAEREETFLSLSAGAAPETPPAQRPVKQKTE